MAVELVVGAGVRALFGSALRGLFGGGDKTLSPQFQSAIQEAVSRSRGRPPIPLPTPPIAPTPAPLPPPVTGEELFDDLLRKRTYRPRQLPGQLPPTVPEFEELLRRPRSPPASIPDELPRYDPARRAALRRAARLLRRLPGATFWTLLEPVVLGDSDLGLELPGPAPGGAKGPPRRPGRVKRPDLSDPGSAPQRPLPTQPGATGQSPPDSRGTTEPSNPAPRPRVPGRLPEPLSFPEASVFRGTPTVPTPTAVPAGSAGFSPSPLLLTPLLLAPLIGRGSRDTAAPRARPIGSVDPSPRIDRLPQPVGLTALQPQPLGFPSEPPGNRCDCTRNRAPKRKRKPREVCYSGRYVERASGITKQRERKIPCR